MISITIIKNVNSKSLVILVYRYYTVTGPGGWNDLDFIYTGGQVSIILKKINYI